MQLQYIQRILYPKTGEKIHPNSSTSSLLGILCDENHILDYGTWKCDSTLDKQSTLNVEPIPYVLCICVWCNALLNHICVLI